MLRRVALVRTDVTEERTASIARVTRIGELGTKSVVTRKRSTLRRNTISSIFSQRVRFLVTTTVVPSSPILLTLMMEALFPKKRRFL
jgi:hypothetical protein